MLSENRKCFFFNISGRWWVELHVPISEDFFIEDSYLIPKSPEYLSGIVVTLTGLNEFSSFFIIIL